MVQPQQEPALSRLEVKWNGGLIAASIAVSLLGAFTSTQMMCQARTSRYFSGVFVWTILGSLTFGFCSIWCLHFIAMLACELPLPIGLNVPLTVLSAGLAVIFTFVALAADLMRDRYLRLVKKRKQKALKRERRKKPTREDVNGSSDALLGTRTSGEIEEERVRAPGHSNGPADHSPLTRDSGASMTLGLLEDHFTGGTVIESSRSPQHLQPPLIQNESPLEDDSTRDTESCQRSSEEGERSRRSSSTNHSDGSSLGLPGFMSFKFTKSTTTTTTNVLLGAAELLYHGATLPNFCKGFIWSLAITTMHYVGLLALEIPKGHVTLQPFIVLLSALSSWLVCTLGCILMPQIEVNLSQQLLFSVVAAAGVAAMHFTGMWATTFWSQAKPTLERGYPPDLAVAVTSIAILTCLLANGLLAHSATLARNKLAEIVHTRRKLWAAIAQKENAEAAAAVRSEFIASASHEIRTPLHQLQGYSDLLSRTELSEEARLLLLAIQQATRSLSMITTNVLDWSRLEKGEAVCRPTSLDLRKVCESILAILPNKDEDFGTELMIVVAPHVPSSLFLDETYLQRILMNLLTNALKFTQSGYVLLLVEIKDMDLAITVRDSGFGIPESFLPQLFEPFKQAQTRGAERGTGLGLAIIRQLLQKMEGTISVESKCHQAENVGSEKCGSTFTVTIPIHPSTDTPHALGSLGPNRRIALLQDCNARFAEGLQLAWKAFDFELTRADPNDEIPDSFGYIWTDLVFLTSHPQLLERVLGLRHQLVILSYDSQKLVDEALGSVPPPHVIPVKRPFLWHRMVENLVWAARTGRSSIDRSVRFAPVVDVVDNENSGQTHETKTLSGSTVLLVEDNKINQKLGVKMLNTLGYDVIVADDGQDAIDKLVAHDRDIDIILMDQSMPRMDGITATKRIREMENQELLGPLSRTKRPIIMVTAVVGPDAQALCMSAGTDAFLPKPLAMSKLEHTLKKFLG
ncbi:uncharacterized protein Z519_09957 [Cladophialophora bantiana CBS 173.52]|uniref:Histidine kinase n=1 Tax=Cladophialophora bantiana (strain ATCC 10958 / CBS 173.52 / CDC B-1940 / NIH 8579) TaxID=1442370 RepID=A0A0D2HE56_CLAB1|nr:uncharacterized protein Z519_09957 [Cladophialophora bantiana CBS 173.52]KIW89105.1 hypothetical protein Z519_09957 [Cladophialophora bantiana CBS 173.52]